MTINYKKEQFSIKQNGVVHFWFSVAVGFFSATFIQLLFVWLNQFFITSYWINRIDSFLRQKDYEVYGRNIYMSSLPGYAGEIPIYPEFDSLKTLTQFNSFALVSVGLGLLVTTRLLVQQNRVNKKGLKNTRKWYITILHSHFWLIVFVLSRTFFLIGLFSMSFENIVDWDIILPIDVLLFLYLFMLSISALRRLYHIKIFPLFALLTCLLSVIIIQHLCKPNFSGYEEAFEKYKQELVEERIERKKEFDAIKWDLPAEPPPPTD